MTLAELHHRVFDVFLKNRPQSLFIDAVDSFLDAHLSEMIDPGLASLLRSLSSQVLLLSSSPDFLVGPIARRLSIENWRGTEYAVDKERLFCKISSLIEGREKLRLARDFAQYRVISPDKISAYSDSDDDLPLLEWVGFPFAVRPNKNLLRTALKRGWKVM